MILQTLSLLIILLHMAEPYQFYNPVTHHLLSRPTLDNIPDGYKLLRPPKSYKRRFDHLKDKYKKNGPCVDAGFTCIQPFSQSDTFQFECDDDYQCPKNYKCCPQKCFRHKICSKMLTSVKPTNHIDQNTDINHKGTCQRWPYHCHKPYDYALTSIFKCERDTQCPITFKCCQQTCFSHKICSRAILTNENSRKESQTTISNIMNKKNNVGQIPGELIYHEKSEEDEENSTVQIIDIELFPEGKKSTIIENAIDDGETTTEQTNENDTVSEEIDEGYNEGNLIDQHNHKSQESVTEGEDNSGQNNWEHNDNVSENDHTVSEEENEAHSEENYNNGGNGEDNDDEEENESATTDASGEVETTTESLTTTVASSEVETTTERVKTGNGKKFTPDSNEIVPEYALYYHDYDNYTYDSDEDEEDEESFI